jgi:2,4-dienoyl-CoA reductase-like NADH-dependent reductase (Old Yellow Enzyme family)
VLDARLGLGGDHPLATDDEIEELVEHFVAAGRLAAQAGFDFVDIKHCHGYFLHELLGCRERPGHFGGELGNRARFVTSVVRGLQRVAPGLAIGVRLSAFDLQPFEPAADDQVGIPSAVSLPYTCGFGVDPQQPTAPDLGEPVAFIDRLVQLGVSLINITAGSPYYNPHIQRPALFPPADGYLPPEDPLVGVARQVDTVRRLKERFPGVTFVGSGYSYLQEWLPAVAAATVGRGWVDLVGLGRMMLSYPELPHHVLTGVPLERKRICRTFSDCTTAPRNGLISGCFPLDPFYKNREEAALLQQLKQHNPP